MVKGRPTKYDRKYIQEAEEYLKKCIDEYKMIDEYKEADGIKVAKEDNTKEFKTAKIKERRKSIIKVKLPTIEGLALKLNVSRKTLYNWAEKHNAFLHTLEKIEREQKNRLLNKGLSGEYNSTIAKLILSSNHGMVERKDLTTDGKELPAPIYGGESSKI